MQAGIEFFLQCEHDGALNLDARETREGFRRNLYIIMRFPARRSTRMTRMAGAIIGDLEVFGLKRRG